LKPQYECCLIDEFFAHQIQLLTGGAVSAGPSLIWVMASSIHDRFSLPSASETAKQRLDRSVQVLTAIAERHSDQTVVVVTHGGFLMGSPHRDPATFYEKFDRSELCRSNVVKVNIVTR
jgi:hypothetical protein